MMAILRISVMQFIESKKVCKITVNSNKIYSEIFQKREKDGGIWMK